MARTFVPRIDATCKENDIAYGFTVITTIIDIIVIRTINFIDIITILITIIMFHINNLHQIRIITVASIIVLLIRISIVITTPKPDSSRNQSKYQYHENAFNHLNVTSFHKADRHLAKQT